jgi:hypothetical protein
MVAMQISTMCVNLICLQMIVLRPFALYLSTPLWNANGNWPGKSTMLFMLQYVLSSFLTSDLLSAPTA